MRVWPRRRVYVDDLPKTHDLRFGILFITGLAALCAILYAVGHVVAGDKVPTGTTVAGVDIGSMSRGEAATVLRDKLSGRLSRPMTVIAGGRRFTFSPQQAGMTLDVDATVAEALGGNSWDPRHMLQVLTGGSAVPPVVDVDHTVLDARLAAVAKQVEVPAVDASVSFGSGQPSLEAGQTGTQLDLTKTQGQLLSALIEGTATVKAPLKAVQPTITTSQAADFVAGPAARAVSDAVVIDVADTALTVQPRQYVPALRVVVQDSALHLDADRELLFARTRSVLQSVPHHPIDARIHFVDGRPVVVPSRSGVTVASAEWADAVLQAAVRLPGKREVAAPARAQPAVFTTAQARSLKITERLSASEVPYSSQVDSVAVRRSVKRLDGILLMPRSSFAFLSRVGAADSESASTVASAAYSAALRAGMTGIVRSAWPRRPVRLPAGFDAQVAAPAPDLRWDDDTPYGVYVRSWVELSPSGGGGLASGVSSAGVVHVEIWSSPYWRVQMHVSARQGFVQQPVHVGTGLACQPVQGSPGYSVNVVRTLSHGDQRSRQTFSSRYPPRAGVACQPSSQPHP